MTLTERAQRLNWTSGRLDLPALILMSDETRLPDPAAAAARLPIGAAVLVRHGDASARRAMARHLAPICRARGLLLFVSDDLALAEACQADGLHLPERRAAGPEAAAIRRRWRAILTVAAHAPRALVRAAQIGADAAIVSPVFATRSHPGQGGIGPLRCMTWARSARLPVYPLGGINARNAGRLRERNLVGLAGIDGLR